MRSLTIIVLASLFFSGCSFRPEPVDLARPASPATPSPPVAETMNAPVTYYEAFARTIRHRLENDLRRTEKVLAETRFHAPTLELLIESVKNAGYTITSAGGDSMDTGIATAPKRTSLAADVANAWNILDLGLSYAQIQTRRETPGVWEEIRRKSIQNIIQEVQYAFARAASAESLMPRINTLLQASRTVLRELKDAPAGDTPEYASYQREMIDIMRKTWQLAERLGGAKTELAVLMKLPPGTTFSMAAPDWNRPRALTLRKTMASLEDVALTHREDLKSIAGEVARDVYQIRQALLRIQPNLQMDPEINAVEEAAEYDRGWWNAGMQVASDLFYQFAGFPHSEEAATSRRQTLQMAVVAQLHLARQRYVLALEQYRLSGILDQSHSAIPPADSLPPAERIARLRDEAEILNAAFQRALAFAELENAASRLYSALGMDRLPDSLDSGNIPTMARSLESAMAQWPALLDRAQATYYPNAEVLPALPPVAPLPAERPASPPETEPSGARAMTPVVPSPASGVIVDASEARSEGRRTAREITIYRDVVTIHFAPDADSPVKGQGLIGEAYPLLGWAPNGWVRIRMGDGSHGWVPTKYIKPVEPETTPPPDQQTPEAETMPEEPSVSPIRKMIVTTTRANVRAMPDMVAMVKYVAEQGTRYAVRGTAGEWFKIRAKDGSDGWLHQSVVTVITER